MIKTSWSSLTPLSLILWLHTLLVLIMLGNSGLSLNLDLRWLRSLTFTSFVLVFATSPKANQVQRYISNKSKKLLTLLPSLVLLLMIQNSSQLPCTDCLLNTILLLMGFNSVSDPQILMNFMVIFSVRKFNSTIARNPPQLQFKPYIHSLVFSLHQQILQILRPMLLRMHPISTPIKAVVWIVIS